MSPNAEQLEAARAAKSKAARALGRFGRVCGVGITRQKGVYVVKVNLEGKPDASADIPKQIDGVPILVRVVGKIRKQG